MRLVDLAVSAIFLITSPGMILSVPCSASQVMVNNQTPAPTLKKQEKNPNARPDDHEKIRPR